MGYVSRYVSVSQIEEFKRCKRKWFFSKVLGIKRESTPQQTLGTWFHKAVTTWFETNDKVKTFVVANEASRELPKETLELLLYLVNEYIKYDLSEPAVAEDDKVFLECERRNFTLADKGIILVGKPDLVVQKKDRIDIHEFKTSSSEVSLEELQMKTQGKIYSWLLQKDFPGLPVVVIYNYVLKKKPVYPVVTKSGNLSLAKITTTQKMILEKIKELGLNKDDYLGFLAGYPEDIQIVQRLSIKYCARATYQMLCNVVDDMNRTFGQLYPYGDENFMCKTCSYIDICETGGDDFDKVREYLKPLGY